MSRADVGEPAPDFELEGTGGGFRLSDHRGRPVVLLFYPGDFTPVCTRQFCSYGEQFDDLDAVVVGISPQDIDSHERFRAQHGITVPLLADTDRRVSRAYGVSAPVLGTRRAVIIVDADGHVAHRDVHALGLGFRTAQDIRQALDVTNVTSEQP